MQKEQGAADRIENGAACPDLGAVGKLAGPLDRRKVGRDAVIQERPGGVVHELEGGGPAFVLDAVGVGEHAEVVGVVRGVRVDRTADHAVGERQSAVRRRQPLLHAANRGPHSLLQRRGPGGRDVRGLVVDCAAVEQKPVDDAVGAGDRHCEPVLHASGVGEVVLRRTRHGSEDSVAVVVPQPPLRVREERGVVRVRLGVASPLVHWSIRNKWIGWICGHTAQGWRAL